MDTNVLSELRKGERANPGVRAWFAATPEAALFLSVLVVGELRRGIESVRARDRPAAVALEGWLQRIMNDWSARVIPISSEVAEAWGRLNVPDPLPAIDALIAATAQVHGLAVVTRNTKDLARTGVRFLNPFT